MPPPKEIITQCREFKEKNWDKVQKFYADLFSYKINAELYELGRSTDEDWIKNFVEDKDKYYDFLKEFLFKWSIDENKEEKTVTVINYDWLLTWFALILLKSKSLKYYYEQEHVSPYLRQRFFKLLVLILLYLFHCIKCSGNSAFRVFSEASYEEIIRAHIYLLAEYAYIDLRIPRGFEINETLQKLWHNEAVLYILRYPYREHFLHSINVYHLGHLLMHLKINNKEFLSYLCPDNLEREKLLKNWLIASLFHDVAYIVHICGQIVKLLDDFKSPALSNYREEIVKALNAAARNLEQELLTGWDYKNIQDHGLLFVEELDHILTHKIITEEGIDKEFEIATKAILKHDKYRNPIDPGEEPLSFLLLLTDHLQEWGRPRMNIVQLREYVYTGIIKSVPQVVTPWTPVEYIKINAALEKKEPLICKSSSKNLHIEIFFSELRERLFEPVLNWLQTTFDFQKIKPFYDNDFDLKISIVHPVPRQYPENVNEFFLFQNFVHETPEMYFLYKWIEQLTSPKGTNEPIEYKFNKDEGKEIYSINLPYLCGKTIIPSKIEKDKDIEDVDIYGKLLKWKSRLPFLKGYV